VTRDEFREAVFRRDGGRCVVCRQPAVDAHHILERRLFPDGGYSLANGAAVCGQCHVQAEETSLSCEQLRAAAGILEVVLPDHLDPGQRYDKWGNPYVHEDPARTQRMPGELFHDAGVQKVLKAAIDRGDFVNRVKYPRTLHVPWSPGATQDDRIHGPAWEEWLGQARVVVTEKMDGENTTMYRDGIHARSLDYRAHGSRDLVKALHAAIAQDIPAGWRVCGENVYAAHSLQYRDLPGYFLVFSVWDDRNACLDWPSTEEWAGLLGLQTVTTIGYLEPGQGSPLALEGLAQQYRAKVARPIEGYVVRPAAAFTFREFPRVVGKYVRANHVQTDQHWMARAILPNGLASKP
jgi:uncharacterized protein YbdZ (MbtH family)